MATLQSTGIGSGLDVNSLVAQLVAAERAPADAQITRQESKVTLQISALASLKGALSVFKGAVDPLQSTEALNPRKVSSSAPETFTATISGSAAAGSYEVEVVALARAHQLASTAFAAGSSATVGTGTLTISMGERTFDVEIGTAGNTLAGIRDAINDAAANFGVQATLINEEDGSRLVLTSPNSGADGAIEVTAAGGDGGLQQLVYDPGTTTNLTQLQAAQDAHIRLAGFDHYSPSNAVSGAIDGVTIDLLAVSTEGAASLDITNDTSSLTERIKKFVSDYNTLQSTLSKLRMYVPATGQAGPLLGDSMLRSVEDEIRSTLTNPVQGLTGAYTSLASIGVSKQADGTLALDQARLSTALSTDRGAVAAIFAADTGVATQLSDKLEARLASSAALDVRNQALQKSMLTISRDKEDLETRMTMIEQRYRKQFSALDALLANLTTMSNYLASQFENLPKPSTGK